MNKKHLILLIALLVSCMATRYEKNPDPESADKVIPALTEIL